jgi:hypothetical protein
MNFGGWSKWKDVKNSGNSATVSQHQSYSGMIPPKI